MGAQDSRTTFMDKLPGLVRSDYPEHDDAPATARRIGLRCDAWEVLELQPLLLNLAFQLMRRNCGFFRVPATASVARTWTVRERSSSCSRPDRFFCGSISTCPAAFSKPATIRIWRTKTRLGSADTPPLISEKGVVPPPGPPPCSRRVMSTLVIEPFWTVKFPSSRAFASSLSGSGAFMEYTPCPGACRRRRAARRSWPHP